MALPICYSLFKSIDLTYRAGRRCNFDHMLHCCVDHFRRRRPRLSRGVRAFGVAVRGDNPPDDGSTRKHDDRGHHPTRVMALFAMARWLRSRRSEAAGRRADVVPRQVEYENRVSGRAGSLQRGGRAAGERRRRAAALQARSRTSSTPSKAERVGYGVLPIENSIGGSIHRNFDLLLEHELPIVGEVELPVVHHLLALPGTHARARCAGSTRTRRRWRSAIGSCGR